MKFKITFKTKVQTDGYTNPSQDYDEREEKQIVVVEASSISEAKNKALSMDRYYIDHPNHYPTVQYWSESDIYSIKKIK